MCCKMKRAISEFVSFSISQCECACNGVCSCLYIQSGIESQKQKGRKEQTVFDSVEIGIVEK